LRGPKDPAPPRFSRQNARRGCSDRLYLLLGLQFSAVHNPHKLLQTIKPPFSDVEHQTGHRNPEYVNRAPQNLITALRQTLQQLEATVPDSADQLMFAELKRILNQRISDLEKCIQELPSALASDKL
jgi:hypothetical protein